MRPSTSLLSSLSRRLGALALGCVLVAGHAVAGEFEEAIAAMEAGDYAVAKRRLVPLAERGDARAQNALGVLFTSGPGDIRDDARAIEWFRRAAEQGERDAFTNIGLMYEEGRGVGLDETVAVRWYAKAAELGDPDAQSHLGRMYVEGRGTARDYAAAMRWFLEAAEQGHAEGQANVGHMYRAGYGVERDYVIAYAWYGVASAAGFTMGPEFRDSVGRLLAPHRLEEARALARELWSKYGRDE